MATPATRTPIKLARGSYSNLYASIDDLQEGEIVYAEDQNQLYVKEGSQLIDVTGDGGGGSGSTNLSYTTSGAGLSLVSSSGSNTDLPAATTSAWGLMTDEDKTKLDNIILDEDDMASDSATKAPSQQSVKAYVASSGSGANLSNTANGTSLTIESSSGTNTALPAATTSAWGVMTDEDKTNLDANTAKVTNATHTGDVTGSGALTIADDAVTYAKMQNVSATDRVLGRDSSGAGVVEEITPANLRTMINVEDGATADQSDAEIRAAVEAASDSNVFTDDDHSKLNGIEASANNYVHPTSAGNVHIPAGGSSGQFLKYDSAGTAVWAADNDTTYSVGDGGLTQNNFTNTLKSKLDGITDNANNYVHPNHSGDVTSSADGATTIANDAVTTDKIDDDAVTADKLANSINTEIAANTAKVTNATHTGDVTGATTLTIADDKIEEKHINAGGTPGADKVLVYDSGESTNWKWAAQSGSGSGTPEGTAVLSTGETGTAKFLRVDGDGSCSWQVPPDTNTQVSIDDTPVNGVTNEAISSNWAYDHNAATGNSAHVPAAGSSGQFLKHDGTWGTPPDTNTQVSIDDTPVNGVTDEAISSNWAYDHNAGTGNSAHVPAAGSSGQFLKHDGTWGTPPDTNTQLTEEQVEDFVGGMVTGNTETGITVTYQDADGTLDFAVAAQTPEGTAILSTGETGGTKFLREDGDGTCSWQTVSGGGGSGDIEGVTAGTGLTGGGTSGTVTVNADVGIADDKLVQIDDADAADDDYAKFTANGIEGRSYTEVKTDLSLNNVENTAVSTWAGTSNITTLGTIGTGTWQGTAIGDTYISSASTWNAKQAALTFGIANTNAVKIDHASVADDDYAKFTSSGVEGRSAAEVKTDLSLNNVENTAVSTWAGSTNITTLGTVNTITSTAVATAGVRKIHASTSAPGGGDGAVGDIWVKY